MTNIENFKKLCKERGIKITPQRTAIFSILAGMKTHPAANEVYDKIKIQYPNISLGTVNRNLIRFSQAGIIQSAESSSGVKRFDGQLHIHNHFICLNCETIIDFEDNSLDGIEFPEEIKNNKIFNKRIILSGICNKCLNQKT
jgi:Fur family peroxide stress response transcriptional regulator